MVAIAVRKEAAQWTDKHGQTFVAMFNPDDLEGSIVRLTSIGDRRIWPWAVIAALRVVMINQVVPMETKPLPKPSNRKG
jgi:hypothetical protein